MKKKDLILLDPWEIQENQHEASMFEISFQANKKESIKHDTYNLQPTKESKSLKKINYTQPKSYLFAKNENKSQIHERKMQSNIIEEKQKAKSLKNIGTTYYPASITKIGNSILPLKQFLPYFRFKNQQATNDNFWTKTKPKNEIERINKTEISMRENKSENCGRQRTVESRKKMMKVGTYNVNDHFEGKSTVIKFSRTKNSFLLDKDSFNGKKKQVNYERKAPKPPKTFEAKEMIIKTENVIPKQNIGTDRIFQYHEKWAMGMKKRIVSKQMKNVLKYKVQEKLFD